MTHGPSSGVVRGASFPGSTWELKKTRQVMETESHQMLSEWYDMMKYTLGMCSKGSGSDCMSWNEQEHTAHWVQH